MPVVVLGFTLRPDGFFDRNPALDVPAAEAALPLTSCRGSSTTTAGS